MAEKNSLWKNIRANKGSGRKPTTEMLRQESKIKAKQYAEAGPVDDEDNRPVRHVKSADDPAYRNYVIQKRLAEFSNLPHSHQTHLMQQDNFKNALNDNNLVSLSDSAWNNFLNPTLDPNSSVFNNPVFTDPTTGLYGSEVFYEDASSRPTSSNTTGYTYIDYPYANPTNLNARWTNSSDPTLSYDVPAFLQNHPPNRYHNKTDYTNLLASDFKRSNPRQFTVPDTQPIENNTNLAQLQQTYPNLTQAELDAVVLNEQTNPGYITNRRDSSGRFIWDWSSNYPANRQNDINFLARRGSYYPESFSNGVNTNMYTMPEWDEPSEYVVIDPQIDELKRRGITNIPIQEDPVKMQEVKMPQSRMPERKIVMFNQSIGPTWGVNPDDPGKEYNLGDKTGWHPYPQGEYTNKYNANGKVIEEKYPSYLDYLKQNSDEYDIQGEYASGGYMYPGGGYTGPGGPGDIKPTRQDSLDVYNSAIASLQFYDSKKQFTDKTIEKKLDPDHKQAIKVGAIKQATLLNPKTSKAQRDIIVNNKTPKVHYINDLVTGQLDPSAPLQRYDERIEPQGQVTYAPKDYQGEFVKSVKLNRDFVNFNILDKIEGIFYGPEDNLNGTKEDAAKYNTRKNRVLKEVSDYAKVPFDEVLRNFDEQSNLQTNLSKNLPGNRTELPYYDPIAIAPFDILKPEQQKERLDKYGPEGIPQSYIDSKNPNAVSTTPTPQPTPTKRKAWINRGANSSRGADGNPLVSEVNFGDNTGWHKVPYDTLDQYEEIKATGGYVNQYAGGSFVEGEDDKLPRLPSNSYVNKEGVINGPVQTKDGWVVPKTKDNTPIVNLREAEITSTPIGNRHNVENAFKMYNDNDPFLTNWIHADETQKRLKENLKENLSGSQDPEYLDLYRDMLTSASSTMLKELPMYSRELLNDAGATKQDIKMFNIYNGLPTIYRNKYSDVPTSQYFSGEDEDGFINAGLYHPLTHTMILDSYNDHGTVAHEGTHAMPWWQLEMEKAIAKKYSKFKKRPIPRSEKDVKYHEYLEGDGMYPRIMDIRRQLNLKSGQRFDKKMLDNESIGNPVRDLRRKYNDDIIVRMFNELASNKTQASPNDPQYAAAGGYINKYDTGGFVGKGEEDDKNKNVVLRPKSYYNPETGLTNNYQVSDDGQTWINSDDPNQTIQHQLPEFEVSDDKPTLEELIKADQKNVESLKKSNPDEYARIITSRLPASGAMTPVYPEMALLPASLPFKAATRLAKAALFGAEVVNPIGGFGLGTFGKSAPSTLIEDLQKELAEKGVVGAQKTTNFPWKKLIRRKISPWGYDLSEKLKDLTSGITNIKNKHYVDPIALHDTYDFHYLPNIGKPGFDQVAQPREEWIKQFYEETPEAALKTRKEAIDLRFKSRFSDKRLSTRQKNRYATWDMYLGKPQKKHAPYDISSLTKSKDDVIYTIKDKFINKDAVEKRLEGEIDEVLRMLDGNSNVDPRYYRTNKDGDFSIVDNDAAYFGTMGGFNWSFKRLPSGNFEATANDMWDLQPMKNLSGKFSKYFKNNIEAGKALGIGKPLNVKVRFEIDPVTKKIIRTYDQGGQVNPQQQYAAGGPYDESAVDYTSFDGGDRYRKQVLASPLNEGQIVGKPAMDWASNWVSDPEFAKRFAENFPASNKISDLQDFVTIKKNNAIRSDRDAANLTSSFNLAPSLVKDINDTQFLYNSNPETNDKLYADYSSKYTEEDNKDVNKQLVKNPQAFTDPYGTAVIRNRANDPGQAGAVSGANHEIWHQVAVPTKERDYTGQPIMEDMGKAYRGKFIMPNPDTWYPDSKTGNPKVPDREHFYPYLQQLRMDNKIQSGEVIDDARLDAIRKSGSTNPLLRHYKNEELKGYLNRFASNKVQQQLQPQETYIQNTARGGYINPYNQYQDDPYLQYANGGYMYGNGGRTWKNIGAGAYGALEGLVDTTFGWIPGVDMVTDMGYKALQKAGNSTADEIREQDSIHGYSQAAGAVTSAIVTGGATTGSAISEGAEGLGQGISKGNESEKWARDVGTGLNIAGTVVGTAYNASDAGKAAKAGFKTSEAGSQGLGKFAASAPVKGFSAAPKGTMQGVIDGNAVSMKPGTDAALSSVTPTASVGTFSNPNVPNINAPNPVNKIADVANAISDVPKAQEPPPMAPPIAATPLPKPQPQTNYNEFAVNPPKINTGFEAPDYNFSYNPNAITFQQGGNITNNSLNLRNTMRYKRFAQGGTFDQYGINMIPDSAGLHHESAYGGVPIGPNALAEGGEIKMDTGDGGQYIVSDQVDGAESQKDFMFSKGGKYKELNRTLADGMKQDLSKYTFGSLATSDRVKGDLRRPNDSYGQSTVEQIKQKWQQKTEYARQRSQQEQAIAQAEEQKKMAEEQYVAAYGGRINPKKYPGLNMTKKAKGGPVYGDPASPHTYAMGGPDKPWTAPIPIGSNVQQGSNSTLSVGHGNIDNTQFGSRIINEYGNGLPNDTSYIYQSPKEDYFYNTGQNTQNGKPVSNYNSGSVAPLSNNVYQDRIKKLAGYAGGGPMVSNVNQPFKGPAAQNRGGMYVYPDGGMVSPEEQMMQEQMMQQQAPQEQMQQQGGGEEQMMQMVQQVAQAIAGGAPPEQVMQQLVQSGVPPEQAQQIIQAAMQMAQQMQQQQPMQGQEQMMPPQGMADGGMMQQQSGAATKIAEALQQGAQPQEILQQLIQSGMPQEQAMAMMQAVMGQLKNQMQMQQPQQQQMMAPPQQQMAPQQPMMARGGYFNGKKQYFWGGKKRPKGTTSGFDENGNAISIAPTNENEMFPESWQSIAAGTAQALPGIAGAAFAFGKLKDRKLTPNLASSVNIDYSPERVALREEGRRGVGMALDTMKRNAPTSGSYMNNAKEAVLRGNKIIGGQISKSWQDQKNEQAKYDFDTSKTNSDIKNKTNEINESMYQNAMEQGFKSSQDAISKTSNYYTGKEGRDIQRWQAQNTNTTNHLWYSPGPGQNPVQVFKNAKGEFWYGDKRIG